MTKPMKSLIERKMFWDTNNYKYVFIRKSTFRYDKISLETYLGLRTGHELYRLYSVYCKTIAACESVSSFV